METLFVYSRHIKIYLLVCRIVIIQRRFCYVCKEKNWSLQKKTNLETIEKCYSMLTCNNYDGIFFIRNCDGKVK